MPEPHPSQPVICTLPHRSASALEPARPSPRKRLEDEAQISLLCRCGALPLIGGACRTCYHRAWRSSVYFGGNRERALERDNHKCRACGADKKPIVHHRKRGANATRLLITLCAACHARVHRSAALRVWLPPFVVALWEEQHPQAPRQLQLDLA